jgi:hypothetical protein
MAKAVQKITLSPSRDIPFNKLVLSQSNVRRVKAGVSIEQLAESIFDFVQGITAVARDKPHQDARLDMEAKAKKLLDRAA